VGIKISIKGGESPLGSLKHVKLKLITISGKGGVGKSLITTAIALGFAMRGYKVGVLDGDVYGPTVPKMLGMSNAMLFTGQDGRILPAIGPLGVKVVSIEFALPNEETAVIWRAPLVNQALRDFISQVDWGDIEVLVVDLPPGTGDAPLTVAQSLQGGLDGSIIVTIPTDISKRIVLKAIDFSKKLQIPIAGVVENMCCFKCPETNRTYYVFGENAGRGIAEEKGVDFLGQIPIDPIMSQYLDGGKFHEFLSSGNDTAKAILDIVDKLVDKYAGKLKGEEERVETRRKSLMKLPGEED